MVPPDPRNPHGSGDLVHQVVRGLRRSPASARPATTNASAATSAGVVEPAPVRGNTAMTVVVVVLAACSVTTEPVPDAAL